MTSEKSSDVRIVKVTRKVIKILNLPPHTNSDPNMLMKEWA